MAFSRVKVWIVEKLKAAELNAEFGNVINGLNTLDSDITDVAADVAAIVSDVAAIVSDEAYDEAEWQGVADAAPSKNSVRDKFESLSIDRTSIIETQIFS